MASQFRPECSSTFSPKMLNLFRSTPAKIVIFVSLFFVTLALIAAGLNSSKSYPNRTKDQIDSLVQKGDPMDKVEANLGLPDTREGSLWHYDNARRSYQTGESYVPASIGIGFNDSGQVVMVLKGPVP